MSPALLDQNPKRRTVEGWDKLRPKKTRAIESLGWLECEFIGVDEAYSYPPGTKIVEVDRKSAIGHIVLEAIQLCADNQIPIPQWAAKSFSESYSAVMKADGKSWDDGFGTPHRNQQHKMREIEQRRDEIQAFIAKTIGTRPKKKRTDDVMNKFAIGQKLAIRFIREVERMGASYYLE